MDALKITSQEHQIPMRVNYSHKEVVIITYSLTSHILHRSIFMRRRCRRRHIASASLAAIIVVCTSTLPRVIAKCGLTITLSRTVPPAPFVQSSATALSSHH